MSESKYDFSKVEVPYDFMNNLSEALYTQTDRDWLASKQGITNKKGEYITLEIIGQKIAKFKEDVENLKRGEYKVPPVEDEVEQLIKSLNLPNPQR